MEIPIWFLLGIFLISIFNLVKVDQVKAGLADHVVINEVQVDSTAGTGGTDDELIVPQKVILPSF